MSITIDDVRRWLSLATGDYAGNYYDLEAHVAEIAALAISQHEELETLRAQLAEKACNLCNYLEREACNDIRVKLEEQLAEKDAMLGKCAEALCEAYNELDAYYYDHPVKVRLRNMMEELDSLQTTTQDVIAKAR